MMGGLVPPVLDARNPSPARRDKHENPNRQNGRFAKDCKTKSFPQKSLGPLDFLTFGPVSSQPAKIVLRRKRPLKTVIGQLFNRSF
jgi:hypothetical protein